MLSVACYSLFVVRCSLRVVCCLLLVVCCVIQQLCCKWFWCMLFVVLFVCCYALSVLGCIFG